jgi:4'-phosphopantetheinyl transferase EntD
LRSDEHDGAGLPLDPAGEWLTAVFSAKEAVFKAIYPTVRQIIEFRAVRIRFTADGGHFQAEFVGAARVRLAATQGVSHFEAGYVLSAAWLVSS